MAPLSDQGKLTQVMGPLAIYDGRVLQGVHIGEHVRHLTEVMATDR